MDKNGVNFGPFRPKIDPNMVSYKITFTKICFYAHFSSLYSNEENFESPNEVHYVSELLLVPKWPAVKVGRMKEKVRLGMEIA